MFELPVDYTKLTPRERKAIREQYAKEQDGNCMWCKDPLTQSPNIVKTINWDLFPPGFTKHPVHLQHCHTTGMTEGAVHSYCNALMWQYHNR